MTIENGSSTVDIDGVVTANLENIIENPTSFLEQLNDNKSEKYILHVDFFIGYKKEYSDVDFVLYDIYTFKEIKRIYGGYCDIDVVSFIRLLYGFLERGKLKINHMLFYDGGRTYIYEVERIT